MRISAFVIACAAQKPKYPSKNTGQSDPVSTSHLSTTEIDKLTPFSLLPQSNNSLSP